MNCRPALTLPAITLTVVGAAIAAIPAPAPAQQTPDAADQYIFQEAAALTDYRKPEGSSFTFTVARRNRLTGLDTDMVYCWILTGGATVSPADFRASATSTAPLTAFPGRSSILTFSSSTQGNRPQQCLTLHSLDDHRPEARESINVLLSAVCPQSFACLDSQGRRQQNDQIVGRIRIDITDSDPTNTISIRATLSGGDRERDTPGLQVQEGDSITWQIIAHTAVTTGVVDVTFNLGGSYGAADSNTGPFTRPFSIAIGLAGDSNDGIYTFEQTITDDSLIENAETIVLSVPSATDASNIAPGGWRLPAPVTVTIPANDGTEFFIDSPPAGPVPEGRGFNIAIQFRGIRNQFSTSINYAVGGSATLGADYEVDAVPFRNGSFNRDTGAGLVVVQSSQSDALLPIRILLDDTADAGETVTVQLSGGAPDYVTFNPTLFTYTITDTETTPLAITGPASVTEAHRDLVYTVRYTTDREVPAARLPFTVTGSATRGSGGTASPVLIPGGPAGATLSAEIIVPLAEDDLTLTAEGAETVIVTPALTLVAPGYGLNPRPASITTQVTDQASAAFIDSGDRGVAEGGIVTVFIGQRGAARSAATTAAFAITGTATAGADYSVATRTESPAVTFDATAGTGTVEIPTGALATGSFDLNILSDADAEAPETLIITLTGHTGAPADAPLAFDDAPLTLTITGVEVTVSATAPAGDRVPGSAEVLDVNEGDRIDFMVAVSGELPAGGVTVDWAVTGVDSAADWTTTASLDNSGGGNGGTLTFTAAGTQSVAVTIAADGINEAAEDLLFAVTGAGAPAAFGVTEAGARIAASNAATYSIASVAGGAVVAEGGAAAYTVTLTAASAADVTIPLTVSGSAAADAIAAPATVTIPAGATTATVTIATAGDELNEAAKTLAVAVGDHTAAAFAKGAAAGAITRSGVIAERTATVTIADDDPAAVTLAYTGEDADATTAGNQVAEGATALFTVALNPASAAAVTVPYSISGAGIDADDYTDAGGGSLTIAAGDTSAALGIAILLDGAAEAAETLTVTLSAPSAGAGAGQVALGAAAMRASEVQIPGNPRAAHAVFFAPVSGGAGLDENDADGESFTVTRTGPDLSSSVTVFWDIVHVSTVAADLNTATNAGGSFVFSGSETSKTVTVAAADDRLPEAPEQFKVELSASSGALQGNGGVQLGAPLLVSMSDNDTVWSLISVDSMRLAEGETAQHTVDLFVARDANGRASERPQRVSLLYGLRADADPATPDLGADEWRDHGGIEPGVNDPFPTGDGTLEFITGQATRLIYISSTPDDLNEADETAVFFVRKAPGFAPRARFGRSMGQTATVAMYEASTADEFAFTHIIEDDDPLTATFAPAQRRLTVDEGATVALSVNFDRMSAGDVTVPYTVTASGALPPAFTDLTGGQIVVPAGQRSGVIRLRSDLSVQRTATAGALTVAFGTLTVDARGGAVSGSGEVVINVRYRQQERTFSIAVAGNSGVEEGGISRFTVAFDGAPPADGRPARVAWAMASDSAAAADFSGATGGMLSFTDNTPQTVGIGIADDALNEAAESFRIALALVGESSGARIDPDAAAAEFSIAESDPLTYSISGDRALESAQAAVFTVALSGRSADAVTVTVATTAGSATAATDFTIPAEQTVTIAAGALRGFFSVPLTGDELNEADETFSVALVSATAGPAAGAVTRAAATTATAVILDDDPVTVAIAAPDPATAVEGGSAAFTVTLNGGEPTTPLRVFYAIGGADMDSMDITAADAADPGAGVIAFSLAQATADPATAMVTLNIAADGMAESAETLTVTITGGETVGAAGMVTAAATGARAQVTIAASNAAAHRFAFANPPDRIAEGRTAVFIVTRSGPAIADGDSLAVQWRYVAGGTAAADFSGGAPAGGAFAFSGEQTRASFSIATADDTLNESDEVFHLQLAVTPEAIAAGAGVGGAAAVAIVDNDELQVDVRVRRPGTGPVVTVGGLDEAQDYVIEFQFIGGAGAVAATAPVEFTWALEVPYPGLVAPAAGRATLPAGGGPVTAAISVPENNQVHGFFYMAFPVTAESAGQVSVSQSPSTLFFLENDFHGVGVTAARNTVSEGETAIFTVASTHDSPLAVTVPYTITAAGATPPQFTDLGGGTVTIPGGQRSATISVATALAAANAGSGRLTLDLGIPEHLALGASSRNYINLINNPDAATVTVNYTAQPEFSVARPGGASATWPLTEGRPYDFPVTLNRPPPLGETLSVRWAFHADDTVLASRVLRSVSAADFCDPAGRPLASMPSGTLEFAARPAVLRQNIRVHFCADNLLEAEERLRLVLSEPAPPNLARIGGEDGGRQTLRLRLQGAETPGMEVTPARLEVTEGGSAQVTVTFTGGELGPHVIMSGTRLAIADAIAPLDDELPQVRGLTRNNFVAEVTSNPFVIPLDFPDDTLNEPTEAIRWQLEVGSISGNVTLRGSVDIHIVDNDALTVTLDAPEPATVREGQIAEFTVQVSGGLVPAANMVLRYALSGDADAADTTDIGAGQLILAPFVLGADTGRFRLPIAITADQAMESAEDLTVTLTAVEPSVAGVVALGAADDITATVTIAASGAARHAVTLSGPTLIQEGQTPRFTVTHSGPALAEQDTFTINWNLAHGGRPATRSTNAADFASATSGSVTFDADNPGPHEFTVATAGGLNQGDTLLEGDESFTVALSASPTTLAGFGGIELGAPAVVQLSDLTGGNAYLLPTATPFTFNVTEGDQATVFVRLTGTGALHGRALTTEIPLRIAYTARSFYHAEDTGVMASNLFDDYPANGAVSIAPGSGEASFALRFLDNQLNEPGASRRLTLTFRHADLADRRQSPTSWATTSFSNDPEFARLIFVIADNDPAQVEFASAAEVQAVEGGRVELQLRLTGAADGSVALINLPYTVTAVAGAAAGADARGTMPLWEDPNGGVVTLDPGEISAAITLRLLPGPADAGDGSITVTLAEPVASTPPQRGSSLPPPVVTASATPARIRVQYLPESTPRLFRLRATGGVAAAEGGMARFTVATVGRPPTAEAPAAVTWRLMAGAGAAGAAVTADLMTASGRLVFTDSAPRSFAVGIADDALNEGAETVTIELTAPEAGGVDADFASAQATIAASDPVTVSISGGGVVGESAGAAQFTVALSGRSGGAIGVPLSFSGSAADSGADADFSAPAVVTVPAGAMRARFAVGIVEDSANEARETLTLTLAGALNPGPGAGIAARAAAAAEHSAALEITDNDAYLIRIAPPDPATVAEGGVAEFRVSVGGALLPAAGIGMPFTVTGEAAFTADDYAPPPGGVFTATAAESTLGIRILADRSAEAAEDFTVTLGAPTAIPGAAVITTAAASATVAANAVTAARTFSLAAGAPLTEGGSASYTPVLIGRAFTTATPLTWTIVHGSTTAADFTAVTGAINFPTVDTFTITAVDDTLAEGAENFAIALSLADPAADGGSALAAPTAASIAASDAAQVFMSSPNTTVSEGDTAELVLSVAGADNGPAGVGITAAWTIASAPSEFIGGIAAGDIGGNFEGGALRIPGDAQIARIRIPIADDELSEGIEAFTVTVSAAADNGAPVTVQGPMRTFNISGSDRFTASFAATALQARTGDEVDLSVLLDRLVAEDVTLTFVSGAARAVGGSSITIPAGQAGGVFRVRILAGDGSQATGTAVVSIVSAVAGRRTGGLGPPAVIAVTFAAPSHYFAVALQPGGDATFDEGAAASFDVRLVGPAVAETLSVEWYVAYAGAEAADFMGGSALGGTLNFAPGAARRQLVTVTTVDDTANETSEAFAVALRNPRGAEAAVDPSQAQADIVINPSDPVTYAFTGDTDIAFVETSRSIGLSVRLSGAVEGGLSIPVRFQILDLSGFRNSRRLADLSFGGGDTSRGLQHVVSDDSVNEPLSVVQYTIPPRIDLPGDRPPVRLSGASTVTVTVTDNDPVRVGFTGSIAGVISEPGLGATGPASATRRIATAGGVTSRAPIAVDFAITGDGITISDLDITAGSQRFGALSGRVLIPAGASFVDLTLAARPNTDGDSVGGGTHENIETATVTLTGASAFGAATVDSEAEEATVTIAHNRYQSGSIELRRQGSGVIREPATLNLCDPVTFELRRGLGATSLAARTHRWRIIGTGANPVNAEDFIDATGQYGTAAAVSGTVSFTQGEGRDDMSRVVPKTFQIFVCNDGAVEGAETFAVRLDPVDGIGINGEFAGTILPPAAGEPVFSYTATLGQLVTNAPATALTEGGDYRINIVLTDAEHRHSGVTVNYAFAGHGANPASAAELPAGGAWTLPAGQSSGFIIVVMPDDDAVEPAEGFTLTLTTNAGQFSSTGSRSRVFTTSVTDDDSFTLTVPAAVAAVEGDRVTLPLRITPAAPAALTVHYTLTPAADPGLVRLRFTDETATATPGRLAIAAGAAGADIALEFLASTLSAGRGRVNMDITAVDVAPAGFASALRRPVSRSVISVALRDFDRKFSVSGPAAPVVEGGNLQFTVSMDGPTPAPGNPALVDWRLDFGGGSGGAAAAAAADLSRAEGNSGTLSFADNMPQTVSFAVVDDAVNEAAEAVTMRIEVTAPAGGGGQGSGVEIPTAGATIAASDPVAFGIAADQTRIGEDGRLNLTLSLDGGAPPDAASVFAGLSFGGDAAADDFTLSPAGRAFAFNADGDDIAIVLAGVDDALNERAETLSIAISTAASAAPGPIEADPPAGGAHMVTVTLSDNDPFTPQLTPAAQSVAEGGVAEFTLALGKTPTRAEQFNLAVSGGGVTADDATAPASIAFAPGVASADFAVAIRYDGAAEAEESMTVTATDAANAAVSAAATVTVPQNAAAARAISVTGPATVAEGVSAAGRAAEFTATLDSAFTADTAGVWRIMHGGTSAADFTAESGAFMFTADATAATFTIYAARDSLNEATETFTVLVGAAAPAAAGGTASGSLASEITDAADDAVRVTIVPGADIAGPGRISGAAGAAGAAIPVVTEGGRATFRFVAAGGSRTADLRITATVSGAAATTDPPFGVLNIAAADSSAEIVLTFTDDDESGPPRTARLTATASTAGAATVIGAAEVRVADDDSVTVTAATADADLLEGETGVVTLTLDRISGGDLTLPWTITAGGDNPPPGGVGGDSAIAGEGTPPATSGRLSIAAGDTSATLNVRSLFTDDFDSGSGRLTVAFTGVEVGAGGGLAAVGGMGRVVFTVTFRMAQRSFRITPPVDTELTEGEAATFSVTLSRAPDDGSPATVRWAVEGVSAADTSGATGGMLTFTHANAAAQDITVTTADDNLNEPTETLTVRLSNPAGGGPGGIGIASAAAAAAVTVADNDAITAAISGPAAANEGDSGVTFTVTLSGGVLPGAARAEVRHSGTLSAGEYTLTADGSGSNSVLVDIAVPDPASATATATFTADFTDDALNEAGETLVLSLDSIAFADAQTSGGALNIAAGAGAAHTVTVADGDPISVLISRADATAAENDSVSIDVQLDGGQPTAEVAIPYTITGAGITAADYRAPADATLRFAAGAASLTVTRQIRIHIRPDGAAEPAETMTVRLAPTAQSSAGAVQLDADPLKQRAQITIAQSAAAAHYFALEGEATVNEGAAVTYRVTRSGAPDNAGNPTAPPPITGGETITVSWTYSSTGAAAASADDFAGGSAPAGGDLTFTAAETAQTFTVTIADDTDNEADERFILDLSIADAAVEGGLATAAPLTVTIAANDGIVVTPSGGGAVNEGDSAVVQLDFGGVALGAALAVQYTVTASGANPAEAADWDERGAGGRAEFQAGESSGSFRVDVVDDDLNEAAETFTVTVTAATTAGPASVAAAAAAQQFTIAASDPLTASIAADDAARIAAEGETVSLTVELDRASAAPVVVSYNIAAAGIGGAPAPTAINYSGSAVTIPPGATSGEIRIASAAVAASAGSGTLTVTLDSATAAHTATATGTSVITVNYRAARMFSIANAHATAAENAGELTFSVTHAGTAVQDSALSVQWAVTPAAEAGRAAVEPADFCDAAGDPMADYPGGPLTFPRGDTEETITLRLCDDTANEGAEYYDLTLSNAAPAAMAQLSATDFRLTSRAINASDPLTLTAARAQPASGAVSEGGAQTFTLTATGGHPAAGATVLYTVGGGDSDTVDADDWSVAHGDSFALTPGQASSVFTLNLTDDQLNEGAETVTVAFASATGHDAGVINLTAVEFALTIAASDPATVTIAVAGTDLDANTAGFQTAEGRSAQ
ncbi:MAG: hypothetical protein OXE47_02295, partial [Gammaproteobacteria bacterium]|nr:hypothetical protein [Gammaproteobacteria bacterium]